MARKPGNEELERKVRNLEPGAHLCCIYEREEEHEAVLTPFLRQGVKNLGTLLPTLHFFLEWPPRGNLGTDSNFFSLLPFGV